MPPIYVFSRHYRIEYKPENYPNLDPVFLYNPSISREKRISLVAEKLSTLDDLPKGLYPKEDFGIIPPMFHFGIPVTLDSFFRLAKDNEFLGFPLCIIESAMGEPDLFQTMMQLRKKICEKYDVDVDPQFESVHLNASEHTQTDLLCFLSSYDVPDHPLPPPELGKHIRSMFGLDYDLKWYLDCSKSDWHIGQLTEVKVGHIMEHW